MIRYKTTRRKLEEEIDAYHPGWRDRAKDRTKTIIAQGKYDESSSIWSEIKVVFMRLQHDKCAYCERALAGETYGRGEHDQEHYRPKSSVRAWPTAAIRRERGLTYPFPTGPANASGYYWISYDLENYAASCKPCNSALKSNYFPIAGNRGVATDTVRQLNSREKPFVIFPIGTLDADPEDLIEFDGIVAIPKATRGHARRRARVTIDFFELNNREELWRGRFRVIRELWGALERSLEGASQRSRRDASEVIDELTAADSPHTSCARNFVALFERDPEEAWTVYQEARAFTRGDRD